MIFVTVGTHNQGFPRLIKKMDQIAGNIGEDIIIQTGFTEIEPKNAQWFKFKDIDDIKNYFRNADIIVAHAGAGTLLDALSFKKPVIAVPRLKKYGEHIDNQQLELTEVLAESGKIFAVYNIDQLEYTIKKVYKIGSTIFKKNNSLCNYLHEIIKGIDQ